MDFQASTAIGGSRIPAVTTCRDVGGSEHKVETVRTAAATTTAATITTTTTTSTTTVIIITATDTLHCRLCQLPLAW